MLGIFANQQRINMISHNRRIFRIRENKKTESQWAKEIYKNHSEEIRFIQKQGLFIIYYSILILILCFGIIDLADKINKQYISEKAFNIYI